MMNKCFVNQILTGNQNIKIYKLKIQTLISLKINMT